MKKILLITGAMLLTGAAFAQGTVTFANATTTAGLEPANRQVVFSATAAAYNPLLVAGANVSSNYAGVNLSGLRVALLYAPTTVTDLTKFSLATMAKYPTFKGSTSTTAGSWFSETATLNGFVYKDVVNLAAVVWDTKFAASPLDAAAVQGLYGTSSIFTYSVAGGLDDVFKYLPQNLRSFSVGMVPEPTSFALLGLGAAAMLIFRRRS